MRKFQERVYDIDGLSVNVSVDYSRETIRVRGNGLDMMYTFSNYLKFPGNMKEFVKEKVLPDGH